MTAAREVKAQLGYEPREAFIPYHTRSQRYAAIVAHRRAGKTVACVADLVDAALLNPFTNPRYAYIAPLLKQAKDTAWDYLQGYARCIPGAILNQNELRADFPNGGRVRLYGGDNIEALRGIYLDGVVLDEYGDQHPKLFSSIIRPTLSFSGKDKARGRMGWATFIGTPKGPNEFHDLWQRAQGDPDYFTLMLRASSSGILDAAELADAARQASTPEEFAREYECSFAAANVGAYYGKEMEKALEEGRLAHNIYDRSYEVHTAWDIGLHDMTVIWFFQKVGFQIRVVDYYSNSNHHFDHYAKVLQDLGYKYGQHYFPHDVKQEHAGMQNTRVATLTGLGITPTIVAKHEVIDGINAVRKLLPKCVFDKKKCAEGIQALQLYHRIFDDQRKVYVEKPYHDWTSHAADSFRYLAMSIADQAPTTVKPSWLSKKKKQLSWIV